MSPSSTLLSTIFLLFLSFASANPITLDSPKITLPIAARISSAGFNNIAEADRARASALRSLASSGLRARDGNVPVINTAIAYTASVGIGIPATHYTLLVDTGSANTWITKASYVRTPTSQDTGKSVTIGSGLGPGEEFIDTVTLSPMLVVQKQSIGVLPSGLSGVDGVLGLGPTDLSAGTVVGQPTVPTVTDNLFLQGTIPSDSLGIYFQPLTTVGQASGELTFGDIDTSKIISTVNFVPITTTSPASQFFGLNQSILYGTSTILAPTAGIVDTGTTLILIASDAFQRYTKATGAVLDAATGLLRITSVQLNNLKSLFFHVGLQSYEITPNAQIWPRAFNSLIGGTTGNIYLIVSDIGTPSGQGLDFINGYVFHERYYTVCDATNHRVGFAKTAFTSATSN